MEDLDFGMEMPTPCEHCSKIFDLNDGYRSEKWHPDIVICEECHNKEQEEIEQDEFWEMIDYELGETLYHLKDKEGAWAKLSNENRALIIQLVSNSLLSSENIKKWYAILTGRGEQEMYDSIKSNDC
jgi:hypothetical protein